MKELAFDDLVIISGGGWLGEALKQLSIAGAIEGIIAGVKYVVDGEGAWTTRGATNQGTTGYVCSQWTAECYYNTGYSCNSI